MREPGNGVGDDDGDDGAEVGANVLTAVHRAPPCVELASQASQCSRTASGTAAHAINNPNSRSLERLLKYGGGRD
jgi:hypothetical protein